LILAEKKPLAKIKIKNPKNYLKFLPSRNSEKFIFG